MNKMIIDDIEYMTIKEASILLGETKSATYKKISKFKTIKINNLILISLKSITDYQMWKNKYLK